METEQDFRNEFCSLMNKYAFLLGQQQEDGKRSDGWPALTLVAVAYFTQTSLARAQLNELDNQAVEIMQRPATPQRRIVRRPAGLREGFVPAEHMSAGLREGFSPAEHMSAGLREGFLPAEHTSAGLREGFCPAEHTSAV